MGVSVQRQIQPAVTFPESHRFNVPFITKCNIPHWSYWSCGSGVSGAEEVVLLGAPHAGVACAFLGVSFEVEASERTRNSCNLGQRDFTRAVTRRMQLRFRAISYFGPSA